MNTTGKKFGGRTKGTPNKLNSKIKDKLSSIISEAYIITKPQQEESPQEQQNFTIEIIDRLEQVTDKETDAAIDNYAMGQRNK